MLSMEMHEDVKYKSARVMFVRDGLLYNCWFEVRWVCVWRICLFVIRIQGLVCGLMCTHHFGS
jgi:hypothetical protein